MSDNQHMSILFPLWVILFLLAALTAYTIGSDDGSATTTVTITATPLKPSTAKGLGPRLQRAVCRERLIYGKRQMFFQLQGSYLEDRILSQHGDPVSTLKYMLRRCHA